MQGRSGSPSSTIVGIVVIAVVVIIALFLILPRSGQPGATSRPSETASESAKPSASATESASASPGAGGSPSASTGAKELKIEASEYKFSAPAETPAGVTRIVVDNVGKEDHQAQVAKIADGKSFADLIAALKGPDPTAALSMLSLNGGPTGVAPGASGATTANLAPGHYAFLCFLPAPDGVPHVAKGMVAPLEVTGSAVEAPLPSGDAELALQDFAFVGASSLAAGQHSVTVTNKGPQAHEATLVKLNAGTTAEDVVKYFTATEPPSGPPPWTSAGGIAGIAPETTAVVELDVEAGDYAFICLIPDPGSGKPHAALGMVGALTVK
jgi:plastocyanin